jgi:hypothetical protein
MPKETLKPDYVEGGYRELLRCGPNTAGGLDKVPAASRLYVVDSYNYRVQYFRDTTAGVTPASFGRVKVVFR